MKIGVPKEIHPDEKRVATTPDVAKQLIDLGYDVAVESGAGNSASFNDDAYRAVGVEIIDDTKALWESADIILKVRAPEDHPELGLHEAELLTGGKTLISFIWPGQSTDLMARLQATGATVMAMDAVPRISRAQKLDALSSMSNIAGYRAVIEAAQHFGRFLPARSPRQARCLPPRS